MEKIIRKRPVLTGIILSLLLTGGVFTISGIYEQMFSPDPDTLTIETTDYSWDFSSGLSLSQSISDQVDEILSFRTYVQRVDFVFNDAEDEGVPGDFTMGSQSQVYYDFNTSSISTHYNTVDENWSVDIKRELSNGNISGDFSIYLSTLPFNNISTVFSTEVAQISNLTLVEMNEFLSTMHNEYTEGKIYYVISQSYRSGVHIRLTLIETQLFIEVSYFKEYYGDDVIFNFFMDESRTDEYYMGSLNSFFPQYTESINDFLELLLGVTV